MIKNIHYKLLRIVLLFGSALMLSATSVAKAASDIEPSAKTLLLDLHNDGGIDNTLGPKLVTCYPNPAVSYINFKFDTSVKNAATLYVYSFTGRQMDAFKVTGNVIKISLEQYFRGLYVYQLRDAHGAILESGKFQVKN